MSNFQQGVFSLVPKSKVPSRQLWPFLVTGFTGVAGAAVIGSFLFGIEIPVKTLPEAQRTQGIESIAWVNLSARIVQNLFQWYFLD